MPLVLQKLSCKNIDTQKKYSASNIDDLVLSLWDNFGWDLTYFGQFIFFLQSCTIQNIVLYNIDTYITDMKTSIDNLSDDIDPMLNKIDDIQKMVSRLCLK